jgi:hypothetical protein
VIYDFPSINEPLRQGDIFSSLPRIDFTLDALPIQDDEGNFVHERWQQLAARTKGCNVLVSIRPVAAILVTQDCDVIRAPDLTFCEFSRFVEVESKAKQTTSAKSWMNIITQHARINLKWFYLPPDVQIGFAEKMAVDFMITIRVPREDVEKLMNLRKGRLNKVAYDHFRERLSEFFRRYAYDEWYPLNQEELAAYRKDKGDIEPFPWQAQYDS